MRRILAEHFQLAQPHARVVRRAVRAEDDLVLRKLLGELHDARLEAPAGFAVDVRRIHRHPEGLERVVAARLDAEVTDDEVDHRELADDRVEHRRDRVRAVAGVDEDDDAEFGALLHRRTQPFKRAVGTVAVHVGMQLQHLEAVFLDVEFQLRSAVFRPPARVVVEVADEAVRVLLAKLGDVGHVVANAFAALAVAVTVAGVARRRLDEAHVDTARLAVDHVGAVHQLEHALAREGRTRMTPRLVDEVGRVKMGIDDHCSLRKIYAAMETPCWRRYASASSTVAGGAVGSRPIMRARLLPR